MALRLHLHRPAPIVLAILLAVAAPARLLAAVTLTLKGLPAMIQSGTSLPVQVEVQGAERSPPGSWTRRSSAWTKSSRGPGTWPFPSRFPGFPVARPSSSRPGAKGPGPRPGSSRSFRPLGIRMPRLRGASGRASRLIQARPAPPRPRPAGGTSTACRPCPRP